MKYLFIDHEHVQRMDRVTQIFHQPIKARGPVVVPDSPWEDVRLHIWSAPVWCEERSRWRMWYYGGENLLPLYAESADGLNWEKPKLGRISWQGSSNNNIVNLGFAPQNPKENRIVLLRDDHDPTRRFKGLTRVSSHLRPLVSPDGLDWTPLEGQRIPSGDEYRLGFDEHRHRFVATVKLGGSWGGRYPVPEFGRAVSLSVSEDFERWSDPALIFWGDEADQENGKKRIESTVQDADRRAPLVVEPDQFFTDVYNMPVFTCEDLYLGLPVMFNQSGAYAHSTGANQDGILYPSLVCSRDLYRWDRLGRQPFIPHSRLSNAQCWDYGMIQATRPVVNGEEWWFYYTGTRFTHLKQELVEQAGMRQSPDEPMGAVFLSRLRMDGFASLHAGREPGVVLTVPVKIAGKKLYVNVDAGAGELRVELRDATTGRGIPGYSLGNFLCDRYVSAEGGGQKLRVGTGARFEDDPVENDTVPVRENATRVAAHWQKKVDVSDLLGREVRVNFYLQDAHLYAFWFGN